MPSPESILGVLSQIRESVLEGMACHAPTKTLCDLQNHGGVGCPLWKCPFEGMARHAPTISILQGRLQNIVLNLHHGTLDLPDHHLTEGITQRQQRLDIIVGGGLGVDAQHRLGAAGPHEQP